MSNTLPRFGLLMPVTAKIASGGGQTMYLSARQTSMPGPFGLVQDGMLIGVATLDRQTTRAVVGEHGFVWHLRDVDRLPGRPIEFRGGPVWARISEPPAATPAPQEVDTLIDDAALNYDDVEIAPEQFAPPASILAVEPGPVIPDFLHAAARREAWALVPDRTIDEATARALLGRLRDSQMRPRFPEVAAEHGLLRKAMISRLLEEPIFTRDDFETLIPATLRRATASVHIDEYLDIVIAVLARVG